MALEAPNPFVDVSPNPDGPGYYFRRSDGSDALFHGEQADKLASFIDRAKPDLRLASNGPQWAPGVAPPPAPPPPQQAQPLGAQLDEANRQAAVIQRATTPTPEQVMGPSAEGAQAQEPKAPAGSLAPWPGAPPAAQGPPQTQFPADLNAPRGGGGRSKLALTGRTVEAEGSTVDPELKAAMAQTAREQIEAGQGQATDMGTIYRQQMEDARAQQQAAALRDQKAQEQIAKGEAMRAEANQQFTKQQQIAQQHTEAESKREVDQFRLFRGKPGAQILASIGIALGAFGGALLKTTVNPALDMINKQIDNDIQAQRDDIQRGVAGANNDLSRIRDKYGLDMDEAAHVLNLAYTAKTSAQAQAMAAMSGGNQAKMGFAQLNTAMTDRNMKILEAMKANIDGKVKTSESYKMQGGGGPMDPLKAEQRKADYARAHYEAEHEGRAPPKEGEGAGGKMTPQAAAADADAALLQKKAAALGLKQDPTDPTRFLPTEAADEGTGLGGRAAQWMGEFFNSGHAKKRNQDIRAAAVAAAGTWRGGYDEKLAEEIETRLHKASSKEEVADIMTNAGAKRISMSRAMKKSGGVGGGEERSGESASLGIEGEE